MPQLFGYDIPITAPGEIPPGNAGLLDFQLQQVAQELLTAQGINPTDPASVSNVINALQQDPMLALNTPTGQALMAEKLETQGGMAQGDRIPGEHPLPNASPIDMNAILGISGGGQPAPTSAQANEVGRVAEANSVPSGGTVANSIPSMPGDGSVADAVLNGNQGGGQASTGAGSQGGVNAPPAPPTVTGNQPSGGNSFGLEDFGIPLSAIAGGALAARLARGGGTPTASNDIGGSPAIADRVLEGEVLGPRQIEGPNRSLDAADVPANRQSVSAEFTGSPNPQLTSEGNTSSTNVPETRVVASPVGETPGPDVSINSFNDHQQRNAAIRNRQDRNPVAAAEPIDPTAPSRTDQTVNKVAQEAIDDVTGTPGALRIEVRGSGRDRVIEIWGGTDGMSRIKTLRGAEATAANAKNFVAGNIDTLRREYGFRDTEAAERNLNDTVRAEDSRRVRTKIKNKRSRAASAKAARAATKVL